jgi:hypothetical protein
MITPPQNHRHNKLHICPPHFLHNNPPGNNNQNIQGIKAFPIPWRFILLYSLRAGWGAKPDSSPTIRYPYTILTNVYTSLPLPWHLSHFYARRAIA